MYCPLSRREGKEGEEREGEERGRGGRERRERERREGGKGEKKKRGGGGGGRRGEGVVVGFCVFVWFFLCVCFVCFVVVFCVLVSGERERQYQMSRGGVEEE